MAAPSRPCPLCGAASTYALTARDRNRETTPERFVYNVCVGCGTVFMVDVPTDLSPYYLGDYYGFGPDGAPVWKRNRSLQEVETYRAGMLRAHLEPGALIDVGAGSGGFAAAARDSGFEVTAIEMDAHCCEYLESSLGVRAICSDDPVTQLKALPAARVISLWHVLEHLRDPAVMLATAADRLEPGGVLALGVPNPRSLQFRLLDGRWHHLDAPRHLTLIPAPALVAQGRTLGLRCLGLTTNDPFGRLCNLNGWVYALRRRPAAKPTPMQVGLAAGLLARLAAPVERTGHRGAALTLLLGKDRAT